MSDPYTDAVAEVLKETGKEIAVPLLKDLVGLAVGDRIAEWRKRQRGRLAAKTEEILRTERIEFDEEKVDPILVVEIVAPAADAPSEELLNLWARLLATAIKDPSRYRASFVEALRKMDPIDALVFQVVIAGPIKETGLSHELAHRTAAQLDEHINSVCVSFENLARLGIFDVLDGTRAGTNPSISAFGHELARALFGTVGPRIIDRRNPTRPRGELGL